jgi:hypothetical protein
MNITFWRLAPFSLLVLAPLAAAQADALEKCRAERDPMRRLACYDAIPSRPAATAPATPAAPAAAAAAQPAAAPPTAAAAFGLPTAAETLPFIESQIAGLIQGWDTRTRFKLANGQVWQVEEGNASGLYLQDPTVRVRRGFAGAYYLELKGTNRSPRVRRLQ